jgi:hypothetical protein
VGPIQFNDKDPRRPYPRHELKFCWLTGKFAVCQLGRDVTVPEWATRGPFVSVTRTDDELSIVCPEEHVPKGIPATKPWTCFKLEGPFPFAQTGVLASFIDPLAADGVPIFAISTYDTDYVLVQEQFVGVALSALQAAGHKNVSRDEP